MTRLKQICAFSTLAFACNLALSIEPLDNYYADDLLEAVDQAREQPHHYDYSNHYRYKRTTAQSIELNRLDLNELEDTHLTMEPGTANTNKRDLLASSTEIPSAHLDSNQTSSIAEGTSSQTQAIGLDAMSAPLQSHYQNSAGSYSTTEIIQSGSVVSTPRP